MSEHGDPIRPDVLTPTQRIKCGLAVEMLTHIRDTRTSLLRASRAVGLRRKDLFSMIAFDDERFSIEEMARCKEIVCAMPMRRHGLVSYRLERWRTPPEVVAREQHSERVALIRYFKRHS